MTKLKSAEEILETYYTFVNDLDGVDVKVNKEDLLNVIKIAQADAIQATAERCAEEAELKYFELKEDWMEEPFNVTIDDLGNINGISKQSILNVATQMKAELNLPKLE